MTIKITLLASIKTAHYFVIYNIVRVGGVFCDVCLLPGFSLCNFLVITVIICIQMLMKVLYVLFGRFVCENTDHDTSSF